MKKFIMVSVLFFVCLSVNAQQVVQKSDFLGNKYEIYESEAERNDGNYHRLWFRKSGDKNKVVFTSYRDGVKVERCRSKNIQEISFSIDSAKVTIAVFMFCRKDKTPRASAALILYFDHDVEPDSFQGNIFLNRLTGEDGASIWNDMTFEKIN